MWNTYDVAAFISAQMPNYHKQVCEFNGPNCSAIDQKQTKIRIEQSNF